MGWPYDLMTLAEFEELPEDTTRQYELQDGVLVTSPLPGPLHQKARFRVTNALSSQLPSVWRVVHGVETVTRPDFPACVRVPDVVVVPDHVFDERLARFSATQVLMVVEIVSAGSRTTDTVVKPVEYAEAGVPYYWTVHLAEPMSVTAYRLGDNGQYEKDPPATGVFAVPDPFPLSLDLTELMSPRKRRVDQ
ncbi:Uma2 family endonuclease [Actinocrispum wychmicini]|nr:Uma2 family endonuclease [Actinocrispum wychmicini]